MSAIILRLDPTKAEVVGEKEEYVQQAKWFVTQILQPVRTFMLYYGLHSFLFSSLEPVGKG